MTYENLEGMLISIVTSRSTLLLMMQQQRRYFMFDFTFLPSCRQLLEVPIYLQFN